MKEPLKKQETPFTLVANPVLRDPRLSFKAKGLFAYLYSKPESWDFSSVRIEKESSDGIDSVKAGLQELEERGYLLRRRKADGRMVYEIYWKPKAENPSKGESLKGEIPQVSNTEQESKTYMKKEEDATQSVAPVKADSFFQRRDRKDDAVPMTLDEFILMCRGSAYRHIRIIGEYSDDRRPAYTTRGQWREFGRRNLRAAARLAPFNDRQLANAMRRMEEDLKAFQRKEGRAPKWGMETIEKYLEEANSQTL